MNKLILKGVFFGVLVMANTINSQTTLPDSVYVYDINGSKNYYYNQKDVFCFRLIDNSKYTENLPFCVQDISYYSNSYSLLNEVHFKLTSSLEERIDFIDYIKNMDNFHLLTYTINEKNENYTNRSFYQTDDI